MLHSAYGRVVFASIAVSVPWPRPISEVNAEIVIEKLVAGGEGLGFLEGKVVFVPGALPGEKIRVHVTERRRDFDRASLIEVIAASPHRQNPPCRLAGICGGCDWLHISYEEQLSRKVEIVREAFRRVGRFAWEDISIHPGPALSYRNRVQMHRDRAGRLGFMGAGSQKIVPVEVCPVSDKAINRVFANTTLAPAGLDRFIVWGEGDTTAAEGIDDERDLVACVQGKKIVFSIGCFFQSNLSVLSKLIPFVMEDLSGETAADLYCGVGLFGAFLSERFERVTAVESSSLSMSYARRNIPGIGNDFYPMNVEQWIESGVARFPYDAVLVDPPRAGLGPGVRRWLSTAKPTRVVYVSCNPVTLARDLGELLSGGFSLDKVGLFDFFPQTSHAETVALLHRP
jgi:23S rRNA (uracil1939-C5)-methyltransferase